MKVLAAQSCLTLRDPMKYSPPGSSVHVFLQARILEWIAFPSPGDLPDSEIKPGSSALRADSLSSETPGTLGGFSPSLTPKPGSAEPQGPPRHCLPAGGSHNSLPEPHTVHWERPQDYQPCHCHRLPMLAPGTGPPQRGWENGMWPRLVCGFKASLPLSSPFTGDALSAPTAHPV